MKKTIEVKQHTRNGKTVRCHKRVTRTKANIFARNLLSGTKLNTKPTKTKSAIKAALKEGKKFFPEKKD